MGSTSESGRQTHQAPTRCSFCDKPQEQVERLIGGPRGVAICNECIRLCNEIIEEARQGHPPPDQAPPH